MKVRWCEIIGDKNYIFNTHTVRSIVGILFCLSSFLGYSQESLLSEIDVNPGKVPAAAAFKGLKIVNFESTKLIGKGQLTFVVAHRFGSIEGGLGTFFGLDNAVTRIKFVYGIFERLNISISRSSYQAVYDASIKYGILRQYENGFPFTVVGYNSVIYNSGLKKENLPGIRPEHRLGYLTQLLISKKFGPRLSLELIPTFFYNNLVLVTGQSNAQYAIGMGGRYKLGEHWSINMEYGLHLNRAANSPYINTLSIGFDVETGGHVFQMHFTNAQPMLENYFLSRATGNWAEGDVYFGFNLSRYF